MQRTMTVDLDLAQHVWGHQMRFSSYHIAFPNRVPRGRDALPPLAPECQNIGAADGVMHRCVPAVNRWRPKSHGLHVGHRREAEYLRCTMIHSFEGY